MLLPGARARRPMRKDAAVSLVLGAALLLAGLLALLASPERPALLAQVGIHLAAGREAGIPAGLAAGLDWHTSAATALVQEWSMLLLGFPLLVLLGDRLHRWPPVARLTSKAEAYAQAHPNVGVFALGGLTLAPFLPIGALTSVLVGELLRLPAMRLLPVLMGAELLANLTVAIAAAAVFSAFPDPRLAAALVSAAMLVATLVGVLLARRRSR